jgi:hypothetical protein
MLNGGGSPSSNYQSHLLHLRSLRELFVRAGIPAERISVLASDGADPAPDLATRELQPEEEFWRLSGTRIERRLAMPITTVNSEVAGVTLQAATKATVSAWFEEAGKVQGAVVTAFSKTTAALAQRSSSGVVGRE